MSDRFSAYRIHQRDAAIEARFEQLTLDDLSPGEVVIGVSHSSINYKDALAATGAGRILRRYPLVGGIDLAGSVVQSADPAYKAGDAVLVTGCGLSETRDGGYAQFARVPASAVVAMPPGLDALSAMALGTAGFAAARAIMRMEINGQKPSMGPVVVTGATGGVGSLAIDMLSAKGYEVVALTGKPESEPYLRALGATQLLLRSELTLGKQPLESARWGGAIDNAGGDTLAWLLRTTHDGGNIASIGLASGGELHTTVMPFILRGVGLLGVNSSAAPRDIRTAVWARLSSDLKPRHLDRIVTRSIELGELPAVFESYLKGSVVGRTVVRIGPVAA
ncbi:MAG TPA: acryloyl-CoA reductase [Steroidobacteraceae bacterium]|nr:acryloyl-CoA reductase [Steroidobacteraceae bacterium]